MQSLPVSCSQVYLFISAMDASYKEYQPLASASKEEACFQELKKKISSTQCPGVSRLGVRSYSSHMPLM